MLRIIRHPGSDGARVECSGQAALGYRLSLESTSTVENPQSLWLPDKSFGVVLDGAIYNAPEVRSRLGLAAHRDHELPIRSLLIAAYRKWGEDMANYLDGDFAFALWDASNRRIYAARDPFGCKPFFYYSSKDYFVFASRVKQVLVFTEVGVRPDDVVMGEFLLGSFQDLDRTFFENVSRLQAGHWLVADSKGVRTKRYWLPSGIDTRGYSRPHEYHEEFASRLERAVAKRLNTSYPVMAHLSGGLDSSSIVVSAAEVYRKSCNLPRFSTVSVVFPGLPCDESDVIDAVTRKYQFESHKLCPFDESWTEGLMEDLWQIDSPFSSIQDGSVRVIRRAATSAGARTILTGLGGDELADETYFFRDLARRGNWFRLIHESWLGSRSTGIWAPRSTRGWWFVSLVGLGLREVIPNWLKAIYRSGRSSPGHWPPWANAEFVEKFKNHPDVPTNSSSEFPSRTQSSILQNVNWPGLMWGIETLGAHNSYAGLETRHPFLDRELVEFALTIPIEQRLLAGKWKGLIQWSVGPRLPNEVLGNIKVAFNAYNNQVMMNEYKVLKDLVFSADAWASEPYIDRTEALRLFESFPAARLNHREPPRLVSTIVTISCAELWLRQLFRYTSGSLGSQIG